jgi:porphobilinogen synthase
VPTFAYQVSGEYSMIRAAAERAWLDGERAMMEPAVLQAGQRRRRLTYFAVEAASAEAG